MDVRGRFEAGATPSREEPYVVVVVDGVPLPAESRLAGAGFRNVLVLAVTDDTPLPAGRSTLRLDVSDRQLDMIRTDRAGAEIRTSLGRPDLLSLPRITALVCQRSGPDRARRAQAPLRIRRPAEPGP